MFEKIDPNEVYRQQNEDINDKAFFWLMIAILGILFLISLFYILLDFSSLIGLYFTMLACPTLSFLAFRKQTSRSRKIKRKIEKFLEIEIDRHLEIEDPNISRLQEAYYEEQELPKGFIETPQKSFLENLGDILPR